MSLSSLLPDDLGLIDVGGDPLGGLLGVLVDGLGGLGRVVGPLAVVAAGRLLLGALLPLAGTAPSSPGAGLFQVTLPANYLARSPRLRRNPSGPLILTSAFRSYRLTD